MAGAAIAIRGRVGKPRFPRERLGRDVIELELGCPCGQPRWPVCRARAAMAFATTGSPAEADEAIVLPVMSRMTARPLVPTA